MLRLPTVDLGPWNRGSRTSLKDFSLFIQKIQFSLNTFPRGDI